MISTRGPSSPSSTSKRTRPPTWASIVIATQRDGRGHFNVRVVSAAFKGKLPLARHRMVYAAVGTMMETDIHALSIDAQTPPEQG